MTDFKPGSGEKVSATGRGCGYGLLGIAVLIIFFVVAMHFDSRFGVALLILVWFWLPLFFIYVCPAVIIFLLFFIVHKLLPNKRPSGKAPDQPSDTVQRNPRRPGSFGNRHR